MTTTYTSVLGLGKPGVGDTGWGTTLNMTIDMVETKLAPLYTAGISVPPAGHLFGVTLSNNVGDPTNDIDIAVGSATDATGAVMMTLASGLTKRLDANWVVGTNQGMLDTGAVANGTYHIFLIQRSDTGVEDILASTSATSPAMPTNYDYKRCIGSILRESAAIVGFVQNENLFVRKATILDVTVSNPGVAAVTRTVSVPTGRRVQALVRVDAVDSTGGGIAVLLSDLSQNDEAASNNNAQTISPAANLAGVAEVTVSTNTSAQFRSRLGTSLATTTLEIRLYGWIDRRGRDA